MAIYFITRSGVSLDAAGAGTKIAWNGAPLPELDVWRASVPGSIILTLQVVEAAAGLTRGVIDIYATGSQENAVRIAANVPGGSLFDANGTLLSVTPVDGPTPPPIPENPPGGADDDFVLIVRQDLGINDINALSGATIAVAAGSRQEQALWDYFSARGMEHQMVVFRNEAEAIDAFKATRTDAVAVSSLLGGRHLEQLNFNDPSTYRMLAPDDGTPDAPDHVITIALLYEAGLGREADITGLNYWIDQHEAGMGLATMAGLFLDSAEFTSRFGDDDAMSNAQFVDVMYLNVLERPGEPAGVHYWIGALDSGVTREAVLIGFAASPENMQASSVVALQEVSPGYWFFG